MKTWLSPREFADETPYSVRQIYKFMRDGIIQFSTVGGKCRRLIHRDELYCFVKRGRRVPHEAPTMADLAGLTPGEYKMVNDRLRREVEKRKHRRKAKGTA